MPLKSEDYGFHLTENASGEVEVRWQREGWGPVTWTMIVLCALGFSIPILGSAPVLFPIIPLGVWLMRRHNRRPKSLRLTREQLVLEDGTWPWDELSEIAVEQPPQLTGLKPGLKLALIEEQARNGFRVVAYRGPKSIVVASDLGLRRAEYLYELISDWAKLEEAAVATANP